MKILAAGNDVVARRSLAIMLGEWGHQVIAAADGETAWRILAGEDAPRLAILDCALLGVSGIEICRRVRAQLHRKPIYLMLLTARDAALDATAGFNAGADDCLTKPVNHEELRARVKNAERIIELQRNFIARASELETALTALETAEADLQNSRERQILLESAIERIELRDIIRTAEQTNVSILITDAQLDLPGPEIVYVNPAFSKMTGYAPGEIKGKTPRILQGAATDFAVLKRLRLALANGEKFFGETVNYRKDGTSYNLEWHISPLKNAHGELTHFVSVQRDITASKQVEMMLRESREYRNLFQLANDSIIVFDPATEIVFNVNDKACENYRISRESFVGMSLKYISLDREHDQKMLEKLFTDQASEEFETVHLRGDGSPMNVLINSSFVEFKGRSAVLSINRDITERRRSELKIKRAKQEWSDTVDAISDVILLEDAHGNIQRCNRAAQSFFDSTYSEIIGQPLVEILDLPRNVQRGVAQHEPLRDAIWEGALGARAEWYEITNHKVPPASGLGWVHIVKNISARKQAETTLRRLNTAIEQAADGIVIMNQSGTIQFVNPAFEQTSEFSNSEIVGTQFFNLKSDLLDETNGEIENQFAADSVGDEADDSQKTANRILAKIAVGEVWHGVYKARRRSGEIYDEEATISPVRDQAGNLLNFVAVCRDVTEKRRLESIAEAVNMMENVGFIFSGIRHELGNPINSLKVALTVLKKHIGDWDAQQVSTYIERCLQETARVEYLLRALKTFSMHENPKMQTVELGSFVQNFVNLVESDFNKRGIRIVSGGNEQPAQPAVCDPRALHQIMLNLLANSADALAGVQPAHIKIKLKRQPNNRVSVQVEDNGAGMNETQLNNLFKPFYTSKPDGTGLGLVIVKKMIAKMNGTVAISSKLGVGTKVNFTLAAG